MRSLADFVRPLKLRLVAMSDPRGGDPRAVARRLPKGAWLIFRHYDDPDRARLAGEVAVICRQRRIALVIGNDLSLAVKLRVGLHMPQGAAWQAEPKLRLWRRRSRPILTVAAHDRQALHRARQLSATAALVSPVFATASHPTSAALGLLGFRRLQCHADLPVIALGGITARSLRQLDRRRIFGVAAIGALAAL
jgi:thiamine-phosphate pyrophosphorylase